MENWDEIKPRLYRSLPRKEKSMLFKEFNMSYHYVGFILMTMLAGFGVACGVMAISFIIYSFVDDNPLFNKLYSILFLPMILIQLSSYIYQIVRYGKFFKWLRDTKNIYRK